MDDMSKFLKECGVVPGRLEKISNSRNIDIYVDYAHTPAALEAVYQTLSRNSELVCVLGAAGGGRDKWKRPELGRIAAQYCKKIILTNEDPYDEDPKNIIEAIEEGIKEKKESDIDFEIIIDRKKAIIKAIEFTKPGQALIVTGKGSENLMMLAHGEKMSWDDREIIKEIIA
ncbi:MAG: UDP-N-acetylmuramoyl-L-alanyl-D-glutamate-2,6-diaminopimelate ligase [Parcubacteria group bacterium GW2011_GWA2_40_8]|nr:MAG: UDP-N-acetylmuramoyl-L-alanyl-D-glutamate-2,6-diaminopimelate ligase [Parcubacteria group bacterium GW2011_GWA2_40_8]